MAEKKNQKLIVFIIVIVVAATLGFAAWMIFHATTRLQ
jgi:flagellar basal body-associated protein FliL